MPEEATRVAPRPFIPPEASPPPPPPSPSVDFGAVDFGEPPPPPPSAGAPAQGGGLDLLDFDAPPPASPPAGAVPPKPEDLELLDFVDGVKPSGAAAVRYQVRRSSGKIFGPFDEPAVAKMLSDGELLGNEEVSTGGDRWDPIVSVPVFAQAVRAPAVSLEGGASPPAAREPEKAAKDDKSLERLKAIYGDRMALITVVDGAAAEARRKKRVPLIVLAVLILVVGGAGASLGLTPYGVFGLKWLFPYRLPTGTANFKKMEEARALLGADTFADYNSALQAAQGLLKENENIVEARAVFAQAAYYLQRRYGAEPGALAKAKRYVGELMVADKLHLDVIKARAGQAIVQGQEDSVRPLLEEAALKPQNAKDLELLMLLGESYLRGKNTKKAGELFEKAAQIDPQGAKAPHALGRVKVMEGDSAAALSAFEKALAASSGHHLSSAVEIASLYLKTLDAPDKAEGPLKQAQGPEAEKLLSPSERARADYLMGLLLMAKKQSAEAEKHLSAALALDPSSIEAKAAYGRFLLHKHEFEKALPLFQQVYDAAPDEFEYVDGLTRALIGLGKTFDAVKKLSEAAAKMPGNPRLAFLTGQVSDLAEKWDEAEANYKRAIQGDKTYYEPPLALGLFYLKHQRLDEAKAELLDAVSKGSQRPETHVALGSYYLAAKNVGEAKKELQAALAIDPEHAPAQFGLARVLFEEGDFTQSRKSFDVALKLDSRVPDLAYRYGLLLWKMNDLDGAIAQLGAAKDLDPGNAPVLVALGAVQYHKGDYASAFGNLEGALALNIADPEAHFYKALIHYQKHENNQAVDAMKEAIERAPKKAEYHFHMGNILDRAGQFGEAIEEWKKAASLKTDYADALEALGEGQSELGNYADAIQAFQAALKADPKRASLHTSMGDCHFKNNAWDKAIAEYKAALKADSRQVAAYYGICQALDEKNKRGEAIDYCVKATRFDSDNPDPYRYLGYAYKTKRMRLEAVEAFRKYLAKAEKSGAKADDAKDIQDEIYDLEGH